MYHLLALFDRTESASTYVSIPHFERWARIALWFVLLLSSPLFAEPITIAHPDEGYRHIERKTLRAAFGMTLQMWPNGRPVTVFVLRDDSPLHQQFCRKVLGVLPYTLRRNWDRLLFSGAAQAPITVNSPKEMLDRVAATPGAIGYIEKELSNDSVSIIEVVE